MDKNMEMNMKFLEAYNQLTIYLHELVNIPNGIMKYTEKLPPKEREKMRQLRYVRNTIAHASFVKAPQQATAEMIGYLKNELQKCKQDPDAVRKMLTETN